MNTILLTDNSLKDFLSKTEDKFTLKKNYTITDKINLRIDLPYTLIIPKGCNIQLTNGSITNDAELINNGQIIINNENGIILNNNTIYNKQGGKINNTDGAIGISYTTINPIIQNDGEICINGKGTFEIDGSLTNTGTININTNKYGELVITKHGYLRNYNKGVINIKINGSLINGGILRNSNCIKNNGNMILINDNDAYKSILTNELTGWIKNFGTLYIKNDKTDPAIVINNQGTICGGKLVVSYDNYTWTGNNYQASCTLISRTIKPHQLKKIRWAFNNRTGCRYVHSIRMV